MRLARTLALPLVLAGAACASERNTYDDRGYGRGHMEKGCGDHGGYRGSQYGGSYGGSQYGGTQYGGTQYGGSSYGGSSYGSQYGGSAYDGRMGSGTAWNRDPRTLPPTTNVYGGSTYGGSTYGGPTYGGSTYGTSGTTSGSTYGTSGGMTRDPGTTTDTSTTGGRTGMNDRDFDAPGTTGTTGTTDGTWGGTGTTGTTSGTTGTTGTGTTGTGTWGTDTGPRTGTTGTTRSGTSVDETGTGTSETGTGGVWGGTTTTNDTSSGAARTNLVASDVIRNWPTAPRDAAQQLLQKYGQPHELTPTHLIWNRVGPWKKLTVFREEIAHEWPKTHTDFLETVVDFKVPADKFDDLAAFDGSVFAHRTEGILGARCDKEELNILALNLAAEIANGNLSAQEARSRFEADSAAFLAGDRRAGTQRLQFAVRSGDTGDPDTAAPMAK